MAHSVFRWIGMKWREIQSAREAIDSDNHLRNKSVRSRQVLRAEARRDAMEIFSEYNEPRRNRRRMALSRARRDWRPASNG